MTVTNRRLLEGLEQTLIRLAESATDPAMQEILSSSRYALDELFARDDTAAIRAHYQKGLATLGKTMASWNGAGRAVFEAELKALPKTLADDANWAACDRALTALLKTAEKTCAVAAKESIDIRALLAWEADGYRFASRQAAAEASQAMEVRAEAILEFIRATGSGRDNAELVSFRPLPGGFSKQTVMFEIKTPHYGNEELVLRAEGPIKLLNIQGQIIEKEYSLLRYVCRRGIKVAEPLWLQEKTLPHHLISRRMPGVLRGGGTEALAPMSDQLLASIATELAKIHALPLDFADPDFAASHVGRVRPATRREAVSKALHEWTDYWSEKVNRASPAMKYAVDWVYKNIPNWQEKPVLVHADCGANNVLIDNDRVSAILDWEISHLGDPAEDVSWILFAMSTPDERERFLQQYQKASGIEVDAFSIKFYEVVTGLKLVIALFEAQEKYQNSPHPQVKLCKLGLPLLHGPLIKLSAAIEEAEKVKRNSM